MDTSGIVNFDLFLSNFDFNSAIKLFNKKVCWMVFLKFFHKFKYHFPGFFWFYYKIIVLGTWRHRRIAIGGGFTFLAEEVMSGFF